MPKKLEPVKCGCGGKPWPCMPYEPGSGDYRWAVRCLRCGIEIRNYTRRYRAVRSWNRAMGGETRAEER